MGMMMNIAKNQIAKIKINFVKKQIEVIDDYSDGSARLLRNYNGWLTKL